MGIARRLGIPAADVYAGVRPKGKVEIIRQLQAQGQPTALTRWAMAVIRANLAWAFGYNVIAVPLVALGYLNPLFAGITCPPAR